MKERLFAAIDGISEAQADKFLRYYRLITEWNEKMNLTAIKGEEDFCQKHFADSLLPMALIPKKARCVDVGTGAGFPGVPLLIMREDISITLMDSLNKRLLFLNEVIKALSLENRAVTLHARCEEAARQPRYRDSFDVALSRAVAGTPTLIEWTAPLVKVGGTSLMYKGPQAADELSSAQNALKKLNCAAVLHSYPAPWGERYVIAARKTAPTPRAFPRKPGAALREPIL